VLIALLSRNLYRPGGGCQKINCFFSNHPYASYGAGWFSHYLKDFSERDEHLVLVQSPSKLPSEIPEMFP
jgi:hypothetical protein